MSTRQATFIVVVFSLLSGLSACSSPNEIPATVTVTSPPPAATLTPSPIPPSPTATPLTCLTQPGRVERGKVTATLPHQDFLIYLPPCYSELTDKRYPVLYLLHGQTYTQDQWVRLGVPQAADQMFITGESLPFIIVFPDDSHWNDSAGSAFGERLIGALLPYIDVNYRTIPNRENRALGGLSRGGGWAIQLGLENPTLFGSLGLHSPAVSKGSAPTLEMYMQEVPPELHPRIWLDAGDNDRELKSIIELERALTRYYYPHEFRFNSGDHSELYWSLHVHDYLRWYASAWNQTPESE